MMRQRGIALITVLVVVAIISGIASSVILEQQFAIRRSENLLHGNQGILYLFALETWAKEVLIIDTRKSAASDHPGEEWSKAIPPMAVEGGSVSGKMLDLQGLFNLNSLVKTTGTISVDAMQQFRCLLREYAGSSISPDHVADATKDWIDPDQNVEADGAEDLDYLSRDPGYRSAGQYFVSPSELLLIDGMSYEAWENIRPFVTAYPVFKEESSYINVNTAPLEVLRCLNIDEDSQVIAGDIVQYRDETAAFESGAEVIEFLQQSGAADAKVKTWRIDVESSYFLLTSAVIFGNHELRMHHLLARERDTNRVKVLMRSFGDEW
jgi:general secretion pathway protein K